MWESLHIPERQEVWQFLQTEHLLVSNVLGIAKKKKKPKMQDEIENSAI